MQKIRNFFNVISEDFILLLTLFLIFFKTVIFLGIINTPNASGLNIEAGFYKIPFLTVYIAFIAAFLSFGFLFKGRGRSIYFIVFNLLYSIILIGDLWYYRGFDSFLSVQLFKMTANLDNMSDSIFSMSRQVDIIMLFDVLLLPILVFFWRKRYKRIQRSPKHFAAVLGISILCLVYMHVRADVLEDTGKYAFVFKTRWKPVLNMQDLSPLGYHVYDSYTFMADAKQYRLNEKDKKNIESWFKYNKENLPDNKYFGMFKGKNVIMLQVESLENFVIGQKADGQEITPNINKLLSNSLYFSNIHEQVNGGTSSDADLMINTSIYPVRSGSTFFRYPTNTYNSLARIYEGEGYTTKAIHPDKGAFWNWLTALKSMGFDQCYDYSYFKHDEIIGLGLSDGSYLRQVEPILASSKQPFYTFMVTLTSHSPFTLPQRLRELKLDETLAKSRLGNYFQSVHYTDKQIGIFLDKLEADGLMDNTVLVLYGDHTGIHKYYQNEVESMKNPESWWVDGHKEIPLIIYNPSLKGEEIKVNGGQIDIYPTICYLTGIDSSKYKNSAMGKNLLNTNKDFAVLADGSVVGNPSSEEEKQKAVEGLDIADKIIRSNYFKNK